MMQVCAPGQLLLLTGSPGCGKTTIAPLVADRAPLSVCLDLDWFFAKLRSGALEPWRGEAHQQNRVVLSAAASAVATFTAGGYFTVADGILYPFMLDLFVNACKPLGIELNYAVLGAPLSVVLSRVQSRRSRTSARRRPRRREGHRGLVENVRGAPSRRPSSHRRGRARTRRDRRGDLPLLHRWATAPLTHRPTTAIEPGHPPGHRRHAPAEK